MTVAILSHGTCIKTKDGNYVSATDWKSFSQWFCLFKNVRLIVRTGSGKSLPQGWIRLPDNIEVCAFDVLNKSYFSRRKIVLQTANKYLQNV